MKTPLLLLSLVLVTGLPGSSQTVTPATTGTGPVNRPDNTAAALKPVGAIDVLVSGEDGKPVPDASVSLSRSGDRTAPRGGSTDESGTFHIANLPVGIYHVDAYAPSLILSPENGSVESQFYRPGETANIQLVKGSVITGTVTDRDGNPIVGVTVSPLRLREPGDDTIAIGLYGRSRQTDDRGIYRLYGLPPGKYLVYAGGRPEFGMGQATPFEKDAPTYFPSSTRETASRVTVMLGQEYSGIDIRYRNEPGFQVSGTISGTAAKNVQLLLTVPGSTEPVTATRQFDQDGQRSFVFSGVPVGTYKLTARGSDETYRSIAAGYMTVRVQGADVNGLDLKLSPLATLSGTIVFDARNAAKCNASPLGPESISLELRAEKRNGDDVFTMIAPASEVSVNSRGEFQSSGLAMGKYRLRSLLAKNNWYVQSIVRPSTRSTATASSGGNPPDSFSLSGGENVSGLMLNVLQDGSVLGGSLSGPDGAPATPAGLHLYLVPAEKERLDDTLRYSEFVPNSDGRFLFRNLSPGKYFLTSGIATEPGNLARPLTWDPKQRAKLIDDARAANVAVELKPCQTISDYQLSVGPDGTIKIK